MSIKRLILTCIMLRLSNWAGANSTIQVGVFSNDSFNLKFKYNRFPVHLDMDSIVFVEVEASSKDLVAIPRECHVSGFKNCTHHPSLGYRLINDYCPDDIEFDYLPAHAGSRAVRFKFAIRQYFGISEQFLYIHCKMTTCRRNEPPMLTVFNCLTQAQYCPYREETDVTMGPFVVWPVGFKPYPKISEDTEPTEQEAAQSWPSTDPDKVCLNSYEVILAVLGPVLVLGLMAIIIVPLRNVYIKRKEELEMNSKEQHV